jgi:hypothetical protein
MTNTQLWALTPAGTKVKLDLYATDPIKLTFTAETLTDLPTINSTYSQTFRMPATGTNNQFFKHWFNVNSNDFDVSAKTQAEIVTESGFFIDGQIRLQKVYRNYESTLVDYEILFLGEVRDFATQVGEGFMNTLDINELAHTLNYSNITTSWNAVPLTGAGLKQGNVLYPLVEYGYSYDSNGIVQQNQLHSSGHRKFTDQNHALDLNQWRPWIRAKYLVDKIFSLTDYSYSSVFFESYDFNNLYINATGNQAVPTMTELVSNNLLQTVAADQTWGTIDNATQYWQWPNEVIDSGNNWSLNTYTAPVSGPYNFQFDFNGDVTWVNIGGGSGSFPDVDINIYYWINGTPTFLFGANNGSVDPTIFFSGAGTLSLVLNAGDTVRFGYVISHLNGPPPTYLFETTLYANTLRVTAAPLSVNPGVLLSDKVKIIDWFKSILKKFRLVMVPDRENPRNFIIEPWEDYIGSGDQYDWTHKVNGSKDIQFEPLFFTQSSSIKFTDQEDADHANDNHQKVFKEVYGTRIYDSNNELLKDERVIDTVFAPTPVERIEGTTANNIIIPHLATLEPVEGTQNNQTGNSATGFLKPIVPKPRLLYYNGLQPAGITWYMYDDFANDQAKTTYPMVSYMSVFPTTSATTNLSWELEFPRFTEPPVAINGIDIYNKYWKGYIDSTYSKDARKMTATFILDSQDLKVKFNDSIFIRDSWWRILKISDAPLNGLNPVKVELIKLLDAPDADCECMQYSVSDNRSFPEAVFYFDYVDCTTGEITVGEVFENSVFVCACEPFASGDPQVYVTSTGAACSTGPDVPVDVNMDVFKTADIGGAIVIQTSTTGVSEWTEVYSQDTPIGEVEINIPFTINDLDFLRIGYSQSDPGGSVRMLFYRDDILITDSGFIPNPEIQWVTMIERVNSVNNYRVDMYIAPE